MTTRHGSTRTLGRALLALACLPSLLLLAATARAGELAGAQASGSGVSIPNDAWTAITLASEGFDTDALHSTATNTARFTISSGLSGRWRLDAVVTHSSGSSTGSRYLRFEKNGSQVCGSVSVAASTGGGNGVQLLGHCTVTLAVGDYVQVAAYQDSGSTRTVAAEVTVTRLSWADPTFPPIPTGWNGTFPPAPTPNASSPVNIAQFTGDAAATLATLQNIGLVGLGVVCSLLVAILISAGLRFK